jgi:6-phosphogluconate dehydrogenase
MKQPARHVAVAENPRMSQGSAALGMIGLGTMGRNLLLNLAEHGHAVVGYDLGQPARDRLRQEAEALGACARPAASLDELLGALRRPAAIMLLVPAGKPVDSVLADLMPRLRSGDVVIDGGNSHFRDTARRIATAAEQGIDFLGMGVSGGEAGARRGPSLMPGGSRAAWDRVRAIFEPVAAQVAGEPCVAYLGRGAAGHYVKMVHNGIEYGLMQLIAEVYDIMRRGLGMQAGEMAEAFAGWNRGDLEGFLLEITVAVLRTMDQETGRPLVDLIRDAARQKGTGMWTSQDALALGVPVPTIDLAVAMRHLSAREELRRAAAARYPASPRRPEADRQRWIRNLGGALCAAQMLTYAQGLDALSAASSEHDFGLDLEAVLRVWRGGCIIRTAMLEPMRDALHQQPDLQNLILAPHLAQQLATTSEDLRSTVAAAAAWGVPAAALSVSLACFDALRSERLPANLIQAQRDCFGAHTYERLDKPGTFHTEWGPAAD